MKKMNIAFVAGLSLIATVFYANTLAAQNNTTQPTSVKDSVSVVDGLKLPENAEIYIDGKRSSKEELAKLKNEDIASMNVTKNRSIERKVTKVTENGQELQETTETKDVIEIYTKQGLKAVEDARPDFKGSVESKVIKISTESGKIVAEGIDDTTEIYFDGIRISKDEMNKLNLKDIDGIEVSSSSSFVDGNKNSRSIILIHSNRRFWW